MTQKLDTYTRIIVDGDYDVWVEDDHIGGLYRIDGKSIQGYTQERIEEAFGIKGVFVNEELLEQL